MALKEKNRFQDGTTRVRATDVAKLAGCAPATVSRAINYPHKVSPKKRAKIEGAMLELGYVRNHAARALRSRRSHMVGMLIPTLDYALYARMVGAAHTHLSAGGISMLIATFDYDLDAELREARLLLERGAEGLILVGERHQTKLYELLDQFDAPFVNTYVFDQDSPYPTVGFDNFLAASEIARHLVHIGHKKISIISGITQNNDRTTRRLEGVKKELSSHGIELSDSMIVEQAYSISGGRKGCAHLLSRNSPRPTAIICGNDILAIGAQLECSERGLAVPDDISIVGFDNLEFAVHCDPPLTTIEVPAEDMGTKAASYLLGKLEGREVSMHSSVDVRMILRRSTAPPKGG
jgi:LacI family transcriptional regulator